MKAVTVSSFAILALARAAQAEPTSPSEMTEAGEATPSVGGNVRGEPNLFDLEFVTARLTLRSPDKTLTTVTVAPWLRPDYNRFLSETRVGIFAESSGAFGIGVGWGYNQARDRLASTSLSTSANQSPNEPQAKLRGPLAAAVHLVCSTAMLQNCPLGDGSDACKAAFAVRETCKPQAGLPHERTLGVVADLLVSNLKPLGDNSAPEYYAATTPLSAPLVAFAQSRAQLLAAITAYSSGSNDGAKKADSKDLTSARAARLERAYCHSLGVNLMFSAGWFPFVDAPSIAPKMGDPPKEAYAERLRNVDVGAALRFHLSRQALVQARGGKRWDRTSAAIDTDITSEYYLGLDIAAIKLFSDGPDASGFQPGVGGGLSLLVYRCSAEGGCSTELELGDPYPKTAALDHRTQITGFIEWRVRKEFQVRLSADVFVDKVKGLIPGTDATDASPRLVHVTPSVSVGSSFWGL